MKARSVVVFFICLNAAAYILGVLATSGVISGFDQIGSDAIPYSQSSVNNQFSLTNFSAASITAGLVGAGIIGLIGWITKQGVYAIYAALIWLIGMFLNIFSFVINGASALVGVLLPSGLSFMSGIIYGGILIVFFYALAGTIGQRPDWG